MGGINVARWLAGGVVGGVLIWLIEGLGSALYFDDMQAAMRAHGLSMEMSASVFLISVVVSLVSGLTLVFFYAATRPRLGPGPRTAVVAAVVLWIGGYLPSLLGYGMMGLFPTNMLVQWGVIGFVEMILAALVGGWLYREV